jgi:hypothetical protein
MIVAFQSAFLDPITLAQYDGWVTRIITWKSRERYSGRGKLAQQTRFSLASEQDGLSVCVAPVNNLNHETTIGM